MSRTAGAPAVIGSRRASAKSGCALHCSPKVLLREWLSDDREPVPVGLAAGQHDHSQVAAMSGGRLGEFIPAHSGHIDVGDQYLDPLIVSELGQGLAGGRRGHHLASSIDLLAAATRVPPWEPLRLLSQDELRSMQLTNLDH